MIRATLKQLLFPIPRRLARNHAKVGQEGLATIEASVRRHYHSGWRSEANYSSVAYRHDLENHISARLVDARRMVIPWLDAAKPLRGTRILEIGCGTGSSTVALTEQGAEVVGIDIDRDALVVAGDRCRVYGLEAEFHAMNACDIAERFGGQRFDSIIFFASLEHMTIAERISALRQAWAILPLGGHLVILKTPNRLWYYDGHTSMLPFFHWLPDELAFEYSAYSPRENFRELYRTRDPPSMDHFLRQGRGASFHEFDIAIRPARELHVVSSQSTFHGFRHKPQRTPMDRWYKVMLRHIYPDIHEGFFDDPLFLIIEKDDGPTGPQNTSHANANSVSLVDADQLAATRSGPRGGGI
jgi:2-polyprenyl-3-methyl-5-hydroxy-6-metoxy-1,4-benzoquinol methylase